MPDETGPYTLDTGDKLRIVVFGQDTLSNTYAVDAAGMVTLPLIGAVQTRDMTTAALGAAIKSKPASGFIREPSVAVEVDVYRPFFMLGEVTYPGQYPYVPHMTVENAVAIAGGFTPRATKSSVTITRKIQGIPRASRCRCATRCGRATWSPSVNVGSDHHEHEIEPRDSHRTARRGFTPRVLEGLAPDRTAFPDTWTMALAFKRRLTPSAQSF